MTKQDFNEGLLGFLDASPTPFHCVKNISMMLENAGFIKLDEKEKWNLKSGLKYYVTRNDSSVIAFTYPKDKKSYTMIGSHTDSPNIKLKHNPTIKENGVVKFSVESYGGMLLNSWFDRDLSLAGRISFLNEDYNIQDILIDVKKSIATIPSLAIHLDDKANKDKTVNKQTDMMPILTTNEDFDFEEFLKWQLSKQTNKNVKKIYSHELSFYDTQKASFVGLRDDFITSARLDNLLSCYVSLLTICSSDPFKPILMVANDHEEVGSQTTSGADGSFLENVLHRMFPDYEEFVQVMRSSLLVSADNAHAIHPNFPTKHDSNHTPFINKGVVIKINANQRYASSSKTTARFLHTASKLDKNVQTFVNRADMGCGSTIGPITASKLGIDTIDIGLPTLAMHSVREVCGSDDAYELFEILLNL